MSNSDPSHVYLALATRLFDRQIANQALAAAVSELPAIDRPLLENLAAHAEELALSRPRLGWSLCQIADLACQRQHCDLFIRSLAAWYLARAANRWEQPQKIERAAARARRGFVKLNEPGWVAACDWIVNDLSWTRPDFVQTESALKEALAGLEQSGRADFAALCRKAFAYHQAALDKVIESETNLSECEQYFSVHNNRLDLARCWINRAVFVLNRSDFDLARCLLKQAQAIFREKKAIIDLAYSFLIAGQIGLFSTTDYKKADACFQRAETLYEQCGLDLHRANCLLYRVMLRVQVGKFEEADKLIRPCAKIYLFHHVTGLYADTLTMQGLIEMERGAPEKSLVLFQQAYIQHLKTNRPASSTNDLVNLGNVYGKMGRFQQALQCLELAIEQMAPLNQLFRLGICEMYVARVWLQLKEYPRALEHLDRAQEALKVSNQADSQVSIARLRAKIHFDQGEAERSLEYLQGALTLTQEHDIPAQTALTHRLMGEILSYESQFAASKDQLLLSLQAFTSLQMSLEQANSLVSLSTVCLRGGDLSEARKHFESALALSRGDYTEVDWHAMAGLAELEVLAEHPADALEFYRSSIRSIANLRSTLWQPGLAGSYAQTPQSVYQKAIPLAIAQNSPLDALQFIETDKAVTLVQQLTTPQKNRGAKAARELQELKSEIDWIQRQMQINPNGSASLQTALQLRALRTRLQEKSQRYEVLLSRLERRGALGHNSFTPLSFSLSRFRELAAANLGERWLALEYYQVENQLFTLAITPDSLKTFTAELTPRFFQALQACRQNAHGSNSHDLEFLGSILIPPAIEALLTPASTLLIAPHQELHSLPWAALGSSPLVLKSIPCVVPSLHSLILLGERGIAIDRTMPQNGLLLGISDFNGAHPPLPFVRQEIAALTPEIGEQGRVLIDSEATSVIRMQLGQANLQNNPTTRRAHYDWVHVASHFFTDPISGRLSSIALSDETLWLDQIHDLAPLPSLVTFSGCSSIFSRVYAGDEHVGLPTTCFIAGANTVVGSAWPVPDESSASLMVGFYQNYLAGNRASVALALAQRDLIRAGKELSAWAGFACLGEP